MICSRWWRASALDVTSNPPVGERAKAAMASSISAASRIFMGLTSTPTDGATDWMTANWPIPEGTSASRRTAARVTPGAICFRTSSHFPLKLYSNCMNPVALRPGRDRVSTNPLPTGSATLTKTIGTVRVARNRDPNAVVPEDTITSGASAAKSAACWRTASGWPRPQK